MPWDRESMEEYDDGYTRESFERAEEDQPEDLDTENDRSNTMSTLLLARRLFDEALPKFNWGASFLDANAIELLNRAPGAILAALEKAERDAATLDALANECTRHNPEFTAVFNRITDTDE